MRGAVPPTNILMAVGSSIFALFEMGKLADKFRLCLNPNQ
jgi:hypothetical protein